MNNIYYCTPEGLQELTELQKKIKHQRSKVVETMSESTKGSGEDLSENNEFLQAQEELDRIEAKYSEIQDKIHRSRVINIKEMPENGKVIFGSTVELLNIDTNKTVTYKIVGTDESNIKGGKISLESPLARNIIGSECGDEIDIPIPSGDSLYKILNIQHI